MITCKVPGYSSIIMCTVFDGSDAIQIYWYYFMISPSEPLGILIETLILFSVVSLI